MIGDKSQATILVELVLAHPNLELFHGPDHKPFAYLPVEDHFETWPIRSRAFKRWMAGLFFEQLQKAPGSQATADALAVLESRALFDGPQREVHVRIAELNGALYLDLGCQDWHVVQITVDGWDVRSNPPVRFRRPSGMQALPHPDHVGSLEDLRAIVNITDEDWPLFLGVMVGMLNPNGPYAVLNLLGEQGSAKTTTCRVARSLGGSVSRAGTDFAPIRARPDGRGHVVVDHRNRQPLGSS